MAVMLVIALLDGSVSAAAGQVSFNQAGVRLFGESKVTAGESYKASNGQEVPTPFPNEAELGVTHGYLQQPGIHVFKGYPHNGGAERVPHSGVWFPPHGGEAWRISLDFRPRM